MFFFSSYVALRALHSFPTRRSSDLCVEQGRARKPLLRTQPASSQPVIWSGTLSLFVCSHGARRSWEINVQGFAVLQLHRCFARSLAVDPRFQGIAAGGKPAQPKSPVGIRHNKIRRVDNKNEPAHVLMNITAQSHQPSSIKDLRRDRPLLRTIAAQIEPFRW